MTYGQHVRWGIFTYFLAFIPITIWISYSQNWSAIRLWDRWWEMVLCFILCIIGSMMPDLDIKSKSKTVVYSLLIPIDLVLILFMYYRAAAIIGFFALIPNVLKHRGMLHSPVAAFLIPAPLLIIPIFLTGKVDYKQIGVSYYAAMVLGYLSHLITDRKE
ncbi:hypothetical protein GF312_06840 [Candidatus Poribacteria bacterium]|nr:hypothetical protein [Candidatus Poribacteria bacterium]